MIHYTAILGQKPFTVQATKGRRVETKVSLLAVCVMALTALIATALLLYLAFDASVLPGPNNIIFELN